MTLGLYTCNIVDYISKELLRAYIKYLQARTRRPSVALDLDKGSYNALFISTVINVFRQMYAIFII